MKEEYRNLARYLCAAVVAHKLRITPTTALKNYIGEGQLMDDSWHELAELLDKGFLHEAIKRVC